MLNFLKNSLCHINQSIIFNSASHSLLNKMQNGCQWPLLQFPKGPSSTPEPGEPGILLSFLVL